jgi:hypothetical protein
MLPVRSGRAFEELVKNLAKVNFLWGGGWE